MFATDPFIERLLKRAQSEKRALALPEGDDPRVLEAANQLLDLGAVSELWLIGSPANMRKSLNHPENPRLRLIDAKDDALAQETRKHFEDRATSRGKALSPSESLTVGQSVLNQAAMLLAKDRVHAVVTGCSHTTADVIRASLKGVGLLPGIKTLSGSFVMTRASEAYLFSDCGVVADPTSEQLSDIAQATAETAKLLIPEVSPKIAFLSFSTKGSAEHPRVSKVRTAVELFESRKTGYLADGELQFDAAFVPEVGARKSPGSMVAGHANCFIFPDLDSGNIGYKIAQRLGGFSAYGPILQGCAKPYLDLSRGASSKDIVVSSLIALIKSLS